MDFTRFLINIGRLKQKRDEIKADEQLRVKSKLFGVISIIFSVITVMFAIAGGFLIKYGLGNDNGIMTVILCIAGGILLISAAAMLIHAFIHSSIQLSVNKLPVGYASLIIAIVILIASIAAVALIVIL